MWGDRPAENQSASRGKHFIQSESADWLYMSCKLRRAGEENDAPTAVVLLISGLEEETMGR